jgi:hypothetical protein
LTENDTVLFEAASVERGPQPRALFEIPETYRIVDEAELAQVEDEAIEAIAAAPRTRTPR